MGVWIETENDIPDDVWRESHPVWVCGLKHRHILLIMLISKVTPCMGVWIETSTATAINI